MARIAFERVAKRFGDVSVIENLDLEVRDHEFMVFVGPSGCGKSTALRMIAGLEEPSEGQLSIGDRVVNDVHPKDRDVAMVFQSYALYPHMTVRENIAFGLKIRKVPPEDVARLVDEAASILGLKPLLDRKPKALSGGQRQRVALGRAIVRNPKVFLFDELVHVALRNLADLEAERDVLADGHVRVQRVALEHHRQIAALGCDLGRVLIADDHATSGRDLEPRDDSQKAALAAAGRTHQREPLAICDREVDPRQPDVSPGEHLANALKRDRRHAYPFTAPAVSPLTMRRWNTRTTAATGTDATTAAAST